MQPDHLRAGRERERLLDDRDRVTRRAEDVDHVDRLRDIGEPSVDLAPQELLTGEPGIDRDHAIAALEQILEGEIARPAGIGGYPDHRDGLYGIEDAADILVVVTVVVHTGATFGSNIGARTLLRKVALVCLPAFRLRRRCEAIMRAIDS